MRAIVESALLERGYASDGAICAPGPQAADPHQIGTGPLHAGEPIVMDIFPQHKQTRYWADMTRTVSKGEPPPRSARSTRSSKRAQDAGIKALRPGVTGREVHELVEDIIWQAGYDTLRPGQKKDPSDQTPRGFIHSTGHGVGLEIHEAPRSARSGTAPLVVGDVVTIEPGVYDPAIGGVRLEDMLVITETGARNFTQAPRELVVYRLEALLFGVAAAVGLGFRRLRRRDLRPPGRRDPHRVRDAGDRAALVRGGRLASGPLARVRTRDGAVRDRARRARA